MIGDIVASVMVREGMDRSALPDTPEALRALVITLREEKQRLLVEKQQAIAVKDSEIAQLQRSNELLREQVRLVRKWRFARSSERWTEEDRRQLRLFDEAEAVVYGAQRQKQEQEEREEIRYRRRKPRRRGRRAISKHLPRREIVHELSEQERGCGNRGCPEYGRCGKLRPVIGEEVREELEFIPAQIMVNRHVYRKYGEIVCERMDVEGEQPGVIEAGREKRIVSGGIVTASLLSQVIVSKFADALPLYRQQRIFKRLGVELSRQTMSGWVIEAARESGRYVELLREKIREGPLINIDETPLQVLKGEKAGGKSWMWVMVGTEGKRRVVVYSYSAHRDREVVKGLLEGYRGVVQSDGYAVYTALSRREGIWDVGCVAHVRRKFHEAWVGAGKKGVAAEGLKRIGQLYRIERELREQGLSEEQFSEQRRKRAAVVLRGFRRWLEETGREVVPGSLLGKAVRYAQGQYRRIVRYLKYGYVGPDNNVAENAIRPFVVGRKNWLFNNTPLGAHASAVMYTLVETAKANNKDPFHFLYRLFRELPKAESREDLEKLLPWNMDGLPEFERDLGRN